MLCVITQLKAAGSTTHVLQLCMLQLWPYARVARLLHKTLPELSAYALWHVHAGGAQAQ